MDELDPIRLSRDISRAAARAKAFLRRLEDGEVRDEAPLEAHRRVSSRATFQELESLHPSDPMRVPLLHWVYRLTELRVNHAALVRTAAEYRLEPRVVNEPEHAKMPLAELLRRALRDEPRRAGWVSAYVRNAGPFTEATGKLWERRREVAARMAVSAPDAIEGIGVDVRRYSEEWLSRTDDLFEEFRSPDLSAFIGSSLGMDAREGWPNRLTLDSLADWFRETEAFRSLDVDPGAFAGVVGASSFVRGLRRLGAAWADAAAPSHQPFVVAHDPYGLSRRKYGALFGGLPANPAFARRRLGLGASRVRDHLRAVARVLLLDSRLSALRALLRCAALDGPATLSSSFEEACERALGFGLPRGAAGALFRPHVDEPQRLAGMFLAASQVFVLCQEHDEDWFRNPRAIERLRSEAALSPDPTTTDDAMKAGAEALFAELSTLLA